MKTFFGAICGLIIMGGSAAAWHYWNIHWFIALLMVLAGVAVIYNAFGMNDE